MTMGCVEFGERLARERRARKLGTQKEFGFEVGKWSRKLGRIRDAVPEETVCRWENGTRYPNKWLAYVLCDMLKMTPPALGLEEILAPATVATIEASIASKATGMNVYHTSLQPFDSTIDGGSLLAVPVDWDRMATLLVAARRLDERTLADLRQLTNFYGSRRLVLGPQALLPAVSSHLMVLRNQLLIAGTEVARQELAVMAGETAVIAGELWHTMLDYGEAAQAFRFAMDLADEFQEGRIRATALTSMAALFQNRLHHDEGIPGEPRCAVNLLDAAASSMGRDASARQRLWFFSARAWQHAALNEPRDAERHLRAAEGAMAQVTGPAEDMFAPWDANYHLVSRARVCQLLGRPTEAVGWYERMLNSASQPGVHDLRRLHFLLKMVAACIEARQLDRAGSLLAGVGGVLTGTGGAMLRRRVQIIVRGEPALAGQSHVKALRDQLDDIAIN
jgi:hypothetical protein